MHQLRSRAIDAQRDVERPAIAQTSSRKRMPLFKKLTPEEKRKRLKRRVVVYGSLVGVIVAFYFYQPQRIHFLMKAPPKPNPPIDPDSSILFSKHAKIVLIQAHPHDSE